MVDDHDGVRQVTRAQLEDAGFKVLDAGDPFNALAACKQPDVRIDLLIADMNMPEMDGLELARRARESRPGLPVLIISGEEIANSDEAVLAKPFDLDDLLAAVRPLLAGKGGP